MLIRISGHSASLHIRSFCLSPNGVFINNVSGSTTVDIRGLSLTGEGSTGILVQNSAESGGNAPEFTFTNTLIGGATGPTGQGILVTA